MQSARLLSTLAVAALACGATPSRDETPGTVAPPGGTGEDPGATGGESPTGDDGSGAATGDDDDGDPGGLKFDTQSELDIGENGDGDGVSGCEKIDFLFVVDNSGSMVDEQANLITSFPGFISTIQDVVQAKDYHLMVTDTDAAGGGNCGSSTCCNADCVTWCAQCLAGGCNCTCNNAPCPLPPTDDCDEILGAGRDKTPAAVDCGFTSGLRYMLDDQPNLSDAFACAAEVGVAGDGNERPMQAVTEAVTTQNAAGACNEGFVRDDAVLVVVVITDEEDDGKSPGNPVDWVSAVVAAKGGDEKAIVPLAIVGDTDLPGAICTALAGDDGADGSPRLREWAESFTFGQWGSICTPDYTSFFAQAVSVIDTACDDFVPPG